MHAGRHAVVMGLGASGAAAARLLLREGTRVTLFDDAPGTASVEAWAREGVEVRSAARDELPSDADLCIVSPGVAVEHPWLARARAQGLLPVPEMELGWSRFRGRVAVITGSNGKSTAVKWMTESLQAAGRRAAACGNYGPPVCRVVLEQPDLEWLVIEASSFQLETTQQFRGDVNMLLNLSPNHLDRHPTMDAYVAAKARIFAQVTARDVCLAPASWITRMQAAAGGRGRWLLFGTEPGADYRWGDGRVWHGAAEALDLRGTYFDNAVLGPNAAAVAGGLHAAGLDVEAAARAARVFRPLPHRMEPVAEARGVRFVNDSKATTLAALRAALEMAGGPVRLIAGGLLKETDLSPVKEMLALRAAGVYLIGKAAEKMSAAWSPSARCRVCGTLEQAVRDAWREARPGEVILLSPGCASFDQFKNYEERGHQFRALAETLAGEKIEWTTTSNTGV